MKINLTEVIKNLEDKPMVDGTDRKTVITPRMVLSRGIMTDLKDDVLEPENKVIRFNFAERIIMSKEDVITISDKEANEVMKRLNFSLFNSVVYVRMKRIIDSAKKAEENSKNKDEKDKN
jgi:hypothetical protein